MQEADATAEVARHVPVHHEPRQDAQICKQEEIEQAVGSHAGAVQECARPSADHLQGIARPLTSELGQNESTHKAPALSSSAASSKQGVVMNQMPVSFTSSAAQGSQFKIVCYGDSLTAGYCSRGRIFQPYGCTLSDTLGQLGIASSVAVCGLVGKTAGQMVEGMRAQALSDSVGHVGQGLDCILVKSKPDLAIIMAGTNDLSRNMGPESIFSAIKKLHELCHTQRIPTVALIPPHKARGVLRKVQERVAGLMIEWSRASPMIVALFDVEKLAPRKPAGHNWESDEIHLSRAGQQALGERLAERLACLPLLKERRSAMDKERNCKTGESADPGAYVQHVAGRKRTLTGFLASTKGGMAQPNAVPGLSKSDTNDKLSQSSDICIVDVSEEDSKRAKVSAQTSMTSAQEDDSKPGKASIGINAKSAEGRNRGARAASIAVARARLCVSLMFSDFAKHGGLSSALRKIAEDLAGQFSKSNLAGGHGMQTIGLSIDCEGCGWSGHVDVNKLQGEGLPGGTIQGALKTLADRSCHALGFSTESMRSGAVDTGSKCSTIRCVTGYLHARDPI